MNRSPDIIYEELLVLFSQGGDEEALAELVRRFQPRLLAYARRLVGDRDGAGDVMQDAWLGIVRGLRRLDDPSRFGAWSRRIVANKSADWINGRQRDRRVTALASTNLSSGDAAPGNPSEDSEAVRSAIALLDDAHRSVVVLHYLEDMGVAEIAAVLGIPSGTVKSRLHTARERLRKALERSES